MTKTNPRDETRGLWLGLLGVVIFAMTLPMTRLAVGPASDPQLAPLFVTAGRFSRQRPSNGFWACAVLGCAMAIPQPRNP